MYLAYKMYVNFRLQLCVCVYVCIYSIYTHTILIPYLDLRVFWVYVVKLLDITALLELETQAFRYTRNYIC